MRTIYDPDLKAHISQDENGSVRHIRHSQEHWESEDDIPRVSAKTYLNEWAETLQIPKDQLYNLSKKVSFYQPREQGIEYQLAEEKHLFDSTTIGYYQTFLDTPVWRRGLSVNIKQNPNRVIGSTNNSEGNIYGKLPSAEAIERYKAIFRQATARKATMDAGLGESEGADETAETVRNLLGVKRLRATRKSQRARVTRVQDETQLLSGRFFIYKYIPERRYTGRPTPTDENITQGTSGEEQGIPLPTLPPVSEEINAGQSYLVAEIVFISNLVGFGGISWLILVEIETGSILYIECMTAGVDGKIFRRDPIVKTGVLTITADDSNTDLSEHRDVVDLWDLDAPVMGTQHLRGTYVALEELTDPLSNPDIAPPTEPSGTNFDSDPKYSARTSEFGAVNAYYHQTELFKTIESLGFPIAAYLDGTTFPIPVDHRAFDDEINAMWVGSATGTMRLLFGLNDLTNTTEPLCRTVDPWVHWHEMGGHGILNDHVGSSGLGFAHSVGDGLAALQMDPESQLRALGLPERFRYAPFRPFGAWPLTRERRFDRDVGTWAWGSEVVVAPDYRLISGDDGEYGSEEILATCHFRIYRSIGGDHSNLGRRQLASKITTYLILRTIDNLTSMTNPSNWNERTMTDVPGRGAELWCEAMQVVDRENLTFERWTGGAYNKVIRWAFEKQGSYQSPTAVPPFTTAGVPDPVDVYIDDGRAGEYEFQEVHWENMSMWNQNSPDDPPVHRPGIPDQTNYMYGKVKNRGTSTATNVTVRAFHSLPGAGLIWPNDFVEMNPIGGLPIPSIAGNSAAEATVGPFEWVPNINAYGHDCILMIASVEGDTSNVDHINGTETIEEWRLVPNDNNIGQRNVNVVPGGGGSEAFIAAFEGAFFMAGNNLNRRAHMELQVDMPPVLAGKGWQLQFDGISDNKFMLKSGEKRKVVLKLKRGTDFRKADIEGMTDRMIRVSLLANDIVLGGMTYLIDPNLNACAGYLFIRQVL